ncbi:MAG: hypothetical protein HZT40_11875 [Candidatus Thiothrix singaporensis]|uniref:Trypsin-co-occurring domain-containing protein n=1 Tax=Candidatus Thiothrix singaporensis TaxID=2799669 RepID=A0A7L6ASR1_9GAMM|nr:MAG: hypothetical protein HZT40_11875 [Candidatus Thiothrix singaporensis]
MGCSGHELKFNLNNIEVEFQTVVEKEGGGEAGGKIKFWVLDIDAKVSGKYKEAATQKVKLSLTPKQIDPVTGVRKDTDLSDDE